MRLGTQYRPDGRGRDTFIFREPLLTYGKVGPVHLLEPPVYPQHEREQERLAQTKGRFKHVPPKVDTGLHHSPLSNSTSPHHQSGYPPEASTSPNTKPRAVSADAVRISSRFPPLDASANSLRGTGEVSFKAKKAPVWKHSPQTPTDQEASSPVKHSDLSGLSSVRDNYDPTPKLPERKIQSTVDRLYRNHLSQEEDAQEDVSPKTKAPKNPHVDYTRWPYASNIVSK